jgi:hypothetical protein
MAKVVVHRVFNRQEVLQQSSYESLTPSQKAWITILAEQEGKNPKRVHGGYKAWFTRKRQARMSKFLGERMTNISGNKKLMTVIDMLIMEHCS